MDDRMEGADPEGQGGSRRNQTTVNPSMEDAERDNSLNHAAYFASGDDSAGNPSMEGEPGKSANVEIVIRRIEESQTNITDDDYIIWRNIGFALAREFGVEGRDYFHRISRFSLKYTPSSCDMQFTAGLNSPGEGITIKTFFYHAKNAGINISPAKQRQFQSAGMSSASGKMEVSSESLKVGMAGNDARTSPPGASVEEMEEPEELGEMEEVSVVRSNSSATSMVSPNDRIQPEEVAFDTPRIPNDIYDVLPEFLQDCVNVFRTPVERDVFLVGALGVISGCLPNIEGRYFGHPVSPHLYVFVAAPAGSGKGNLKWARLLGDKIHSNIYWTAHHAQNKYLDDKDRYRKMNPDQLRYTPCPEPPQKQMLYLSPNLGIDSFLQTLQNSHSRGIVFETEADTLQATLRHRWSPFSDILRKAFHHETIQLDNRKDLKPIEVDNPHLSVVLAGTPDQVRQMMPDTENGLFSRFLFYAFEDDPQFSNPFGNYGNIDLQEYFLHQAYLLYTRYAILADKYKPLPFCLTPRQEKDFYDVFEYRTSINRGILGKDFEATTRRMGLIAYRIAMVLSGLRLMEDDTGNEPVTCRVEDFWTAIELARIFEEHAISVYNSLPKTKLKGARNVFFNALPDTFTRKEYLTVAASLDLNPKTAEKYIGQMKADGLLGHGFNSYRKKGA